MSRDPAVPRFLALQLARAGGAALALFGVVVLSHGQPALAAVPDAMGDALIVGGAGLFFALPLRLARQWKAGGGNAGAQKADTGTADTRSADTGKFGE
jgi:hypothetical protein